MKTRKGFTIVELIIVIAVIGVLAAILIPTFSGVIEKANMKSDISDLRNVNTIIATHNVEFGDIRGGSEIYGLIQEAGFTEAVLTPSAKNHIVAFDQNTQQLCYIEAATGTVVYPAGISTIDASSKIAQPIFGRESMLANASYNPYYILLDNLSFTDDLHIENSKGIDLGGYALHCESLTIDTIAGQPFSITNGSIEVTGTLTINGHHVDHNDDAAIFAGSANISLSSTSYVLDGTMSVSGALALNSSRFVKNEGSALQFGSTTGGTVVNAEGQTITPTSDTVTYSVDGDDYATFALAYAEAEAGDTIEISAGNATIPNGHVTIDKSIDVKGAGKYNTRLNFAGASKLFYVKGDNMTFSDMSMVGKVQFALCNANSFSSSNITFDNMHFDGPLLTGAIIAHNYLNATTPVVNKTSNLQVLNCSFLRTTSKAMYLEGVNGLTVKNCWFRTLVSNPDTPVIDTLYANLQVAIDINLKGPVGSRYGAIMIDNCDFKDYGAGNPWGGAIAIKERGTGVDPSYAGCPGRFTSATIKDCAFDNCLRDVIFGEMPGPVVNEPLAGRINLVDCRSTNKGGVQITDFTITSGEIEIFTCTLQRAVEIKTPEGNTRTYVIKKGSTFDLGGLTLTLGANTRFVVEAGGSIVNGTLTLNGGTITGAGSWPGK